MALRFIASRLPITRAFAGKRAPAFARFNSTSSTSGAAQIVEMARAAQNSSPLEAAVPVMWLLSGAFIYTAFNRIDERKEDHVEKLLIV